MCERYRSGDRVRVYPIDPSGHTRVPRYVRGTVGTIVELQGWYVAAGDRAAGRLDALPQPVYTVLFSAGDLWGSGDHSVTVDVWEANLSPSSEEGEPNGNRPS